EAANFQDRTGAKGAGIITKCPRAVLRTGIQDGDGAAVLGPAGDVVANRNPALLTVGNGPHAVRVDATRGHEVANRLGPAGAERDVVLARASLIRVTLDRKAVPGIGLQPLDLLFQRRDGLRGQIGLVAFEKDAITDIDHEILRATRSG